MIKIENRLLFAGAYDTFSVFVILSKSVKVMAAKKLSYAFTEE